MIKFNKIEFNDKEKILQVVDDKGHSTYLYMDLEKYVIGKDSAVLFFKKLEEPELTKKLNNRCNNA